MKEGECPKIKANMAVGKKEMRFPAPQLNTTVLLAGKRFKGNLGLLRHQRTHPSAKKSSTRLVQRRQRRNNTTPREGFSLNTKRESLPWCCVIPVLADTRKGNIFCDLAVLTFYVTFYNVYVLMIVYVVIASFFVFFFFVFL